ncbi:erythromycin esterase family protein [Pontibacter sp. 13R65]|uniref:erythromycin esterase family protein n=1 Tax=Pontibacter sp. 13R65 TaxID=3127458 RepID=UPI00301D32F9
MKRKQLLLLLFTLLIISCSKEEHKSLGNNPRRIPAEAIHKLETEQDLDTLIESIGNAQIVLLGESSHGTAEFYTWRTSISQRLINEKRFKIIAIVGDWTDAYQINKYIRGNNSYSSAKVALKQEFNRWPTWMWANEEVAELTEWLRSYNTGRGLNEQVGFYGLDVYSMWESMEIVLAYLEKNNSSAAEAARMALHCFAPYNKNENAYARATYISTDNCADELSTLLETVQTTIASETPENEEAFNALQNTLVAVNAENYYRTAAFNNALSWNIRDRHMTATIKRLLEQSVPNTKIIVWEHNSHVGDARATDMADQGLENVGQQVREQYGEENTYIIGFGTYSGKVIAAQSWGNKMQVMDVPQARSNSWEALLHKHEPANKIIFMHPLSKEQTFQQRIGHRAIGVVYNPASETGNYVPTVVPERYDAFIFLDRTTALTPLQ